MSRSRGLRREAPILLPASLLLLAMLASVTLLSYRSAVARFSAEREQETLRLAGSLAEAVHQAKSDDFGVLARWLPSGASLALYDERGELRTRLGFSGREWRPPLVLAGELATPRIEGIGQRRKGGAPADEWVRAIVPLQRGGQRFVLCLDVPEPLLFAQQRSLRIMTPVVFGLSLAVALLAISFLRALVRPYEALLEKARTVAPLPARAAGSGDREAGDEVEFLLATFDRALAALRSEGGRSESAEHALSAVERTLGPQLESGLLMFDREGRLLAANPAAVALLGGGLPTARGQAPGGSSNPLAGHPQLASLVADAIAGGRSISRATVAIEREGRRLEVGLTLQALRQASPAAAAADAAERAEGAGFLMLFADVTDLTRRETEERFEAGLAQLGELSAGVAHELRNSLATVQGYLTLAARRELPPEAREDLAEAQREAGELSRIVDDFLTFARPGSGVVEPVDLSALVARAVGDPSLGGVPIELRPGPAPLPPIAGDPHLLHRALRNLLLNAVQATVAHPANRGREAASCAPVVVSLSAAKGMARITVEDDGIGLSPAIRERLFQPFSSGRPGGAGLGLALARRIVVMHGGVLELTALEPRGVRAEIRLPLVDSDT